MKEYVVDSEGIRLDKELAKQCNEMSRMRIQRLIDEGSVLVNGEKQKSAYKVKRNDIVTISETEKRETKIEPQAIALDIVYEDKDIMVINKPKGLVVHPGNGNPDHTLVNAIIARCKENLSEIGGEIRPGIVHRLDKDTSGLIIVAKNDKTHVNMSKQIKDREVKKTYIALVRGNIVEKEATINMPIARSTKNRIKMAVSKKGKEAITHFTVIKRYGEYTLIEVNIETGRTHQIRVHMAEINHPVVGDMVYSNGKNKFYVVGQLLHAKNLEFKHPITGDQLKLEAELPKYFKEILIELEKENAWNK